MAMGGAFVGTVDDREAVHINPAALALVSSPGEQPMLDADRYPHQPWELRWDFTGLDLPLSLAPDLYRFQDKYRSLLQHATLDTLINHSQFFNDLWALDREPIPIDWNGEGEFVMHDFGFGGWGGITPQVSVDHGAVVPQLGIGLKSVQAIDVAVAQSFGDEKQLDLGIGYRLMAIAERNKQIDVLDIEHIQDTALSMASDVEHNILNPSEWGHGLNLGAIWFQTPELRWGLAAQNVAMKLREGWVTPDIASGLTWSPWIAERDDAWARRVNFSAQWSDWLGANYPYSYMPLAHIDLGVEWTQVLWPKVLEGRISSGLHQGYPTFGFGGDLLRVLHMDAVTYAEETGVYLGQAPERYYTIKFGVGF
jgi:hypothetical protein